MSTRLVLLGGFLGAGKTTTLISTARKFQERGKKVAIVTNDQGKELIDTELARLNNLDAEEVTGGCFCCRFDDLYEKLNTLRADKQPDIIISEAVGSCTDLSATVIQPMKQYYSDQFHVSPLTVVVDPARLMNEIQETGTIKFSTSVGYIFEKQLSEADIIVLNKVDYFQPEEIDKLTEYLQQRYPQTIIQPISAYRGDHLDELLDLWLTMNMAGDKILDIDYDVYAEGESKLAWLNILGDLRHKEGASFDGKQWVETFLSHLNQHIVREKMAIAHLKIHAGNDAGFIKASMVQTGDEPFYTIQDPGLRSEYRVVINIRIESTPALLDLAVEDSIYQTNQQFGSEWTQTYHECFSPLPPQPIHRLSVI